MVGEKLGCGMVVKSDEWRVGVGGIGVDDGG